MRLLQITPTADPASGGPIEAIVQTARACRDLGCTTDIVTLDDPAACRHRTGAERIIGTGPGRGRYGYAKDLGAWLTAHAPAYDAVLVNGLWQYPSFCVWRSLGRRGPPYFVFPHGMLDPWGKHAQISKYLKKAAYWRAVEHRVLRDARAVLFTSEQERRAALETYRPFHGTAVVVPFGTLAPPERPAAQARAFRAALPALGGRAYVLFLGRLHPKKGCDLLIEGFARVAAEHPESDLVVAGPDQVGWLAALRERARQLGIEHRVHWPGLVRGEVKWGALRQASALILPSHQENFGVVVAEALACGVPVLVSDKVNIWREVVEDEAGLVAADSVAGTESLLRRYLSLPEPRRAEMSRWAKACFKARFDLQMSARAFLEIISSGLTS